MKCDCGKEDIRSEEHLKQELLQGRRKKHEPAKVFLSEEDSVEHFDRFIAGDR